MSEPLFVIDNKRVWCIDPATGQVAWKRAVGGIAAGGAIESVMLDGQRLFVCAEFTLHCLDARTGEESWHVDLEGLADNKSLVTESHPVVQRMVSTA